MTKLVSLALAHQMKINLHSEESWDGAVRRDQLALPFHHSLQLIFHAAFAYKSNRQCGTNVLREDQIRQASKLL
jgi:hypothetical protein